jgi:hypothetical protein
MAICYGMAKGRKSGIAEGELAAEFARMIACHPSSKPLGLPPI